MGVVQIDHFPPENVGGATSPWGFRHRKKSLNQIRNSVLTALFFKTYGEIRPAAIPTGTTFARIVTPGNRCPGKPGSNGWFRCLMHQRRVKMKWETPEYNNIRFGFEVTMYINNK